MQKFPEFDVHQRLTTQIGTGTVEVANSVKAASAAFASAGQRRSCCAAREKFVSVALRCLGPARDARHHDAGR
eukprot:2127978-Pleurochrysis_carterae.AAC.1